MMGTAAASQGKMVIRKEERASVLVNVDGEETDRWRYGMAFCGPLWLLPPVCQLRECSVP